jgi:hypothetical protein
MSLLFEYKLVIYVVLNPIEGNIEELSFKRDGLISEE